MGTASSAKTTAINPRWLATGLLVTLAGMVGVAVTACKVVTVTISTEQQSQTYQKQINRIELDLEAGNITLSPGDSSSVRVGRTLHWRSTKPTIEESFSDQTMRVRVTCPQSDGCSADFTIEAPAGVSVQAKTQAGDVKITDISGALDIANSAGDIRVTNAIGEVRITGDSGQISGTGLHSHTLTAKTDSGDIELAFTDAPQTVDATTQSGDVTVTVPHTTGDYRVQADTNSGRRTVSVGVNSSSSRSITARTDAGDVTIT
jgi:DUF4097 and DUF4098 domain-containing protein YvlB